MGNWKGGNLMSKGGKSGKTISKKEKVYRCMVGRMGRVLKIRVIIYWFEASFFIVFGIKK